MVSIRIGRSGFFYFFFETYKYAPSSKITQACLFLSYYSLSIIWHAVQCFWFQTSIKCTRKWTKLLKSETNTETETNFRILQIFIFFGIKNVRVDGKMLGSVGRSEKHIFFFLALYLFLFSTPNKFQIFLHKYGNFLSRIWTSVIQVHM
jgi:hypothetical protein